MEVASLSSPSSSAPSLPSDWFLAARSYWSASPLRLRWSGPGAHHLVSCHQTGAGVTSGVTTPASDEHLASDKLSIMDTWGDLTSLSWLHDVKILPNVDQQDTSKENTASPESTLKQLLRGEEEGNSTTMEAEPLPIRTKSPSTAVKINFSSLSQSQVVAKKSKAVSGSDNDPSSQLTTKDCQQLLFRILNDKRDVLTKQAGDELEETLEEEEVEDNGKGDFKKSRRKEECNLFRSLSEEAKKQILTKKIQIQSKTSVKSLCLHFSSLTKVNKKVSFSLYNIFAF